MKAPLKIGDTVAVLDDNIKGLVIAVKKNNITIEDQDGFDRIYLENELIRYDQQLDLDQSKIKKQPYFTKKPKLKKTFSDVIDLHSTATNTDQILAQQLQTFHTHLNTAIRNHKSKIIFIHGVGEGILRKKIETFLNKKQLTFSEAPYHKYGQGAIEIFLNY